MKPSELREALADYRGRLSQEAIDERVAYLLRTFPSDEGSMGTKNRERCVRAVEDVRYLLRQAKPYGIPWTSKNRLTAEALAAAWIVLALRTWEGHGK
jgi:hypothetical protein